MPKIVDHDQYRKQLLMKAFDLFAEKGYGSVTMRQLAQALGVSTGTLYHYFSSKEALFLQLVEEQTRQDILQIMTELKEIPSPTERIEALFEYVSNREKYFLDQILLGIEFYQHNNREELIKNQVVKTISEEAEKMLNDFFGFHDPQLLNLLGCTLHGIAICRFFEGDAISYAEQGKLFSKMLFAYFEQQKLAPIN